MELREKGYKVVSASAAAIESLAKPAVKEHHKVLLEGSGQIHDGVDDFFDTMNESTKGRLSWFFRGMKKINHGVKRIVKESIKSSYVDTQNTLMIIEKGLSKQQDDFEQYFRENNRTVHHNWAFSKENREMIRELSDFIKDNTRELKNVPYHKIIQYFIAFGKIQKIARLRGWRLEKLELSPKLQSGLEGLNTFCKYAVGIYGKMLVNVIIKKKWLKIFASESDEQILQTYTNTLPQHLLYSHIQSKKYLPGYAIILNPSLSAVILVIRGTMSIFDCITDIRGEYIEYTYLDPFTNNPVSKGQVHSGILTSAINLSDAIRSIILETLSNYPEYSLYICGHSLGAGTTALLSLLWLSDPEIMRKGFKSFAYAPPPVVSAELNVYLKDHLYSCVYGNDIVCRLSFGSLRDMCEMVKFWKEYDGGDCYLQACNIASNTLYGGHISEEILLEVYKEVRTRFVNKKLEPPGNVLQVYKEDVHKEKCLIGGEDKYLWAWVESTNYEEIVFSSSCLADHFPNLYEDGLKWIAGEREIESED